MSFKSIKNSLTQINDPIEYVENFYISHCQNLADHSSEILPSAAVGIGTGFSAACAFRALAIVMGKMPIVRPPRFLSPYLPGLPGMLAIAGLGARFIGDAYYNYCYKGLSSKENIFSTSIGTGFTFVSGFATLAETLGIGVLITKLNIPMTGMNMLAFSLMGGFLSASQDMYLRNHYKILDLPLQA